MLAAAIALMAAAAAVPDDPVLPDLACERGFEPLVAEAKALPGGEYLPADPSLNFKAIATEDGHVIYGFTEPGHPAYPTFTRRQMHRQDGSWVVTTRFCPYGRDEAAFQDLIRQYRVLDQQLRAYLQERY